MHSLLKTGIVKGKNEKYQVPKYGEHQEEKTEVEPLRSFPSSHWTTLATKHGREKNVCVRLSSPVQLSRHSRTALIYTNNVTQLRPSCLPDSRSTKGCEFSRWH